MKRGVKIGADVPYCLMRGTALAEGIGERLTRLPNAPQCQVLLAKPAVNVSTREIYEKLILDEQCSHPDIDALIEGIRRQDIRSMAGVMGNVLEKVTSSMHPVIQKIKDNMMELGAMNTLMSGSGPTVFGLFEDSEQALVARDKLRQMNIARQVYTTEFFNVGSV